MVLVLGLASMVDGAAEASTHSPARHAPRHRHRAGPGAGALVARRQGVKRAHQRRRRPPAPPQPEVTVPPEVAFVTLTTPAQGTSFYVDSHRVGTGSTVHQSLPPGYHHVQAVHPSGARWQRYLSFEAGDDRKLIVYW